MINADVHSCVFLGGRFEENKNLATICECLYFVSLCLLLQIFSLLVRYESQKVACRCIFGEVYINCDIGCFDLEHFLKV